MKYETPEIEVALLEVEDIVTSSEPTTGDNQTPWA